LNYCTIKHSWKQQQRKIRISKRLKYDLYHLDININISLFIVSITTPIKQKTKQYLIFKPL
jgi:hypothetical protein